MRLPGMLGMMGLLILLAATALPARAAEVVKVGSKRFTESYVLAEIARQTLQRAGVEAEHRQGLGNTAILEQALRTGQIDLYPEYTGTILRELLGRTMPAGAPAPTLAELNAWLAPRGLMATVPLGFDNTYAIAVRRDFAEKHNLEKVSDLVPLAPNLTIATDADFLHREEVMSFTNFTRTYGLKFKKAVAMTYGLMYRAAYVGDVDVIMAYSSDGRIAAMDLKLLEDDLQFFPPYDAILIVRNETLAKYPELEPVLNLLTGRIDQEAIQRMNARADVEGHDLKVIAEDFLKEQGLI